MRFHCLNVQEKPRMLIETLRVAGHTHSPPPTADLLLIDIDDPDAPQRGRLIDQCPGIVMLYQHGAIPSTYHGFYQPDDRIDIQVVHGPGGARLAAELGLGREIATAGWSYSPSVPFAPVDEPERVLFGPIHPYGSGALHEQDRKINARVYDKLRSSGLNLAIQMYGSATSNGLPAGVNGYNSRLMLDWSQIDQADLIVAEGTLACLALARGKPVVMFGQDLPRTDEHNRPSDSGPVVEVPRYPVDIDDANLDALIAAACMGAGQTWREEFVGGPFDRLAFLAAVDSAVAVAT